MHILCRTWGLGESTQKCLQVADCVTSAAMGCYVTGVLSPEKAPKHKGAVTPTLSGYLLASGPHLLTTSE